MPEKRNHKWELFKSTLERIRITTQYGAERKIQHFKFLNATSVQERAVAFRNLEAFTGEAMAFLNDNLTARLSPLHPTRDQIKVFQFLMENIRTGKLKLNDSHGKMWPERGPVLINNYYAEEKFQTGTYSGIDIWNKNNVSLISKWVLSPPASPSFGVFGNIGYTSPRAIDFVTLPAKAEDSETVRKTLGILAQRKGFTQKVGVYGNGERFVINTEGKYKGKEVAMTDQFFFLGAFDGASTGLTYWLYGCNTENQSRMDIKENVRKNSLATQSLPKR